MSDEGFTNKQAMIVAIMAVYTVILLYLILLEVQRVRRMQEATAFAGALASAITVKAPRVKRGR